MEPFKSPRLFKKHAEVSLIRDVLVKTAVLAVLIMVIMSTYIYYATYNRQEEQTLQELRSYVQNRVLTDSEIFHLAEDNLKSFTKEFMALYLSDLEVTEKEFWTYYFVDEDGATRMRREFFDGVYSSDGTYRYGLSSFIGNNQPVDDPDFQRRLMLSYNLLAQLGPAWINRFDNVHVSYPENGIVIFWPETPWGLSARADLPMNELGTIRAATQEANPERKPVWSGLYYDETAEKWMITYQVPVDYEGRHLVNPSLDVPLSDIMERVITQHPTGAYNFIMRKDGYLVAHPSEPTDDQRWVGQLSLDKINIPSVVEAYRLINEQMKDGDSTVRVIENRGYDNYLIVGELEGPDWWFISVFPTEMIKEMAHRAALSSLFQGMLLLAVLLLIVLLVMYYQAAKPLQKLRHAAEVIGKGEYNQVAAGTMQLPTELGNEIGLLSRRFVEMAKNVRDVNQNLEQIVEERTRDLERANSILRDMSLLDGLTGIHNRRAFDASINQVASEFRSGIGTFSLAMMDVDYFKHYNDTYGHAEGDYVLKEVARTIKENIRNEDRVFRYGGEEFAIILGHTDTGVAKTKIDADAAKAVVERVLEAIRQLQISHKKSPHGIVTLSAGLNVYNENFSSPDQLVKAADENLYTAKKQGRNQFVC